MSEYYYEKPYYGLKRENADFYIQEAIFPPRLSVWTNEEAKCHMFEHKREAEAACEYIKKEAWNVIVFEIDESIDFHLPIREEK